MGRLTFLGTGTSHGVPMIGCRCPVCTSTDPHNHRYRSSVLVETESLSVVIDTPPEFRLQALRANLRTIDAVLVTHSHADHVFGFDDLRIFSQRLEGGLPCYASIKTACELRTVFSYVLNEASQGGGIPEVTIVGIDGPVRQHGVDMVPIPVKHGRDEIFGYRIGKMAYITDCSCIPEESYGLLEDLEVLVLGALRFRPHGTHFTVSEALAEADRIRPAATYLTHIAHDIEHESLSSSLPEGVYLAYDCLQVGFSEEDPV